MCRHPNSLEQHQCRLCDRDLPPESPPVPSLQDVSKRLSLPMDIRLPPEFLQKLQMESLELPKPLSRMSRRASLVSGTHRGGSAGHGAPRVSLSCCASSPGWH